jgi:TolB-like protein/Tfp pilus assembly protein PilF
MMLHTPHGHPPGLDLRFPMASPLTENAKPERVLVSWKEISAFLNRAERTVKRWERERGLPVHRVPGGERGGVYAYPSELTDWLKGKSNELEADDAAPVNPVDGPAAELATEIGVAPAETAPAPAPAPVGTRRTVSSARVAAWLLPLGLTAAFIVYLSGGHAGSHVTAVGDRGSPDAAVPDLASDSVAVLPFTNAGGDSGSDYLSDGITESLIGNLAHIPQLRVRSRDAVFRLKGKDMEVQEAGSQLGVSEVVSGRVTAQGNHIEISAELTDVRDNTEIWGKRYTGKMSDLIQMQEQIAGDVAATLRTNLSAADRQRVTRQGTQDAEAYTLYLKGRYGWNRRDRAELEAAISFFNEAIERDPGYALAYSGLADVYSVLPNFWGNPNEDFPKSNAAARKALELDPTLAHPHAVLGANEMEYDWDFTAGEAEFRKALALDPNDATAHQWYAERISQLGRHQEALSEINRAHELDPMSPVITRVIGGTLVDAGQYDQAIDVCKRLAQGVPTFPMAHDCLFYAYWAKRMYPQAIEEWKIEGQLTGDPDDIEAADAMERGFRSGGWKGGLAATIAVFEARRAKGYASPFIIARFYADMGDKDKAFDWLDTALREHDRLLVDLNVSPGFDNIRSDPRFAELVRKVGLPNSQ